MILLYFAHGIPHGFTREFPHGILHGIPNGIPNTIPSGKSSGFPPTYLHFTYFRSWPVYLMFTSPTFLPLSDSFNLKYNFRPLYWRQDGWDFRTDFRTEKSSSWRPVNRAMSDRLRYGMNSHRISRPIRAMQVYSEPYPSKFSSRLRRAKKNRKFTNVPETCARADFKRRPLNSNHSVFLIQRGRISRILCF